MIIQCTNCNKKFNVDSSLIPLTGRNFQCGSCNHIWFYNPNFTDSSTIESKKKIHDKISIKKTTESSKNYDQNNKKNNKISAKKKKIILV